MPNTTSESTMDTDGKDWAGPQPASSEADFTTRVNEMVTDQAPRVFAVVLEDDDQKDATIAAWGMAFADQAYMLKSDGRSQFFLADAENALMYIPRTDTATPQLVWVDPAAAASHD